jgi:hypothetical protein
VSEVVLFTAKAVFVVVLIATVVRSSIYRQLKTFTLNLIHLIRIDVEFEERDQPSSKAAFYDEYCTRPGLLSAASS